MKCVACIMYTLDRVATARHEEHPNSPQGMPGLGPLAPRPVITWQASKTWSLCLRVWKTRVGERAKITLPSFWSVPRRMLEMSSWIWSESRDEDAPATSGASPESKLTWAPVWLSARGLRHLLPGKAHQKTPQSRPKPGERGRGPGHPGNDSLPTY